MREAGKARAKKGEMKMKWFVIAMVCAMLALFGCTATNPQAGTQVPNENITTSAPTAPMENSTIDQTAPAIAPNLSNSTTVNNSVQSANDIEMADAIASNLPYICQADPSKTMGLNLSVYVLGNMTKGVTSLMGNEIVTINTPDASYANTYPPAQANPAKYAGCKWFKNDLNRLVSELNLSGVNATEFSAALTQTKQDFGVRCNPGSFGAEAFTVNGQVCDITNESIANLKALSAYGSQ